MGLITDGLVERAEEFNELRSLEEAIEAGEHLEEADKPKAPFQLSAEGIAKFCHQVNSDYRSLIGEGQRPSWEDASDHTRASAINGVHFVIQSASDPNPYASAQAQHDEWLRFKLEDGWGYGEEIDEVNKKHPCVLPFSALPMEQKIKDVLFRRIVQGLLPLWNGQ